MSSTRRAGGTTIVIGFDVGWRTGEEQTIDRREYVGWIEELCQ